MDCKTPEKIAFKSKVDAYAKSKSVEDWHGNPMRVYFCQCGRFHLTSIRTDSASEPDAPASS